MSAVLRVEGLCKEYSGFRLDQVSFAVDSGSIMGFIGRNGAGKTTTLKALLNLVHPSAGEISFFGLPLQEYEREIKQRIGYAAGGIHYYQRKRMKEIVAFCKALYPNWDEGLYAQYLQRFGLDERKRPIELSEGMKVKFNLTMALSHHAELLILDEPTSGLDPVSRDDLLEEFLRLAQEGVAILFSTHITSDLDKCADAITYIQQGRILASAPCTAFVESYRLVQVEQPLTAQQSMAILGMSHSKEGSTALIRDRDAALFPAHCLRLPDLQSIMVHLEKEKSV